MFRITGPKGGRFTGANSHAKIVTESKYSALKYLSVSLMQALR
jgi:hypothetical protein